MHADPNIPVRRLGAADLPAMHGMLDLFAAAFEDPESYASARPDAAYLARLLADPTFFALVAEQNGMVGRWSRGL